MPFRSRFPPELRSIHTQVTARPKNRAPVFFVFADILIFAILEIVLHSL